MSDRSYQRAVGERLRWIRRQKGLSLRDLEEQSRGRFKASVVSAYERGTRSLSAQRFLELARFYDVPPTVLLPHDVERSAEASVGVTFDLERLAQADLAGLPSLRRFVRRIREERGDYDHDVLTVRRGDVRRLADALGQTPSGLIDGLVQAGVVVSQRPLTGMPSS